MPTNRSKQTILTSFFSLNCCHEPSKPIDAVYWPERLEAADLNTFLCASDNYSKSLHHHHVPSLHLSIAP